MASIHLKVWSEGSAEHNQNRYQLLEALVCLYSLDSTHSQNIQVILCLLQFLGQVHYHQR